MSQTPQIRIQRTTAFHSNHTVSSTHSDHASAFTTAQSSTTTASAAVSNQTTASTSPAPSQPHPQTRTRQDTTVTDLVGAEYLGGCVSAGIEARKEKNTYLASQTLQIHDQRIPTAPSSSMASQAALATVSMPSPTSATFRTHPVDTLSTFSLSIAPTLVSHDQSHCGPRTPSPAVAAPSWVKPIGSVKRIADNGTTYDVTLVQIGYRDGTTRISECYVPLHILPIFYLVSYLSYLLSFYI